MKRWLLANLSEEWGNLREGNWSILFGIARWSCWKWRNEFIFGKDCRGENEILSCIWDLFKVCLKSQKDLCIVGAKNTYLKKLVGWSFPEDGWVKFNVDGACKGLGKAAGCGGVLRDASGSWILGFSKSIGNCNSFEAELWGLLTGLEVAWDVGFKKICMELDSKAIVDLFVKGDSVLFLSNVFR